MEFLKVNFSNSTKKSSTNFTKFHVDPPNYFESKNCESIHLSIVMQFHVDKVAKVSFCICLQFIGVIVIVPFSKHLLLDENDSLANCYKLINISADNVHIRDYSYISTWYNRDYDSGSSGPGPHQAYMKGKSLFKLCEVGTTLGTSTTKVNFHDAVTENQDCKNMNLYKCVAFCLSADDCQSVIFFQGPMDASLKEPRYLCVEMKGDLDDTAHFPADDWGDLTKATCTGSSCSACTHKSTGGVSPCMLREFLKTRDDDKLSPFTKRTGARVVFMDHMGSSKAGALKDVESKCYANKHFFNYNTFRTHKLLHRYYRSNNIPHRLSFRRLI